VSATGRADHDDSPHWQAVDRSPGPGGRGRAANRIPRPRAVHEASQPTGSVGGAPNDRIGRTGRERGVELVPVRAIRRGRSVRLNGEEPEHIRTLAGLDGKLPPVLVHRPSLSVIDGNHRISAALLRGDERIEVSYFDGDEAMAFVAAVAENVTHGLPLSLADRKAAASRIIEFYPQWSDRRIADCVGLSAGAVATIRRTTERGALVHSRVGRDGRARPVDATSGRLCAAKIINENPTASLRQVARAAGISPGTVRDVRSRISRGENPVPDRTPAARAIRPRVRHTSTDSKAMVADPIDILDDLRSDPSLRYSENGRKLLRVLHLQVCGVSECRTLIEQMPPHSAYRLAKFATSLGEIWRELAASYEEHTRSGQT
jgi:hypothetical protein